MKKLILVLCLISFPLFASTEYRDGSDIVTTAQINTNAVGATESIPLGPYQAAGVQCVWASVTGTQPIYKLQTTNDDSNWDNVTGASTTTTGGSGSATYLIEPLVARYARIYVSTTSTTGTLNCKAVLKR